MAVVLADAVSRRATAGLERPARRRRRRTSKCRTCCTPARAARRSSGDRRGCSSPGSSAVATPRRPRPRAGGGHSQSPAPPGRRTRTISRPGSRWRRARTALSGRSFARARRFRGSPVSVPSGSTSPIPTAGPRCCACASWTRRAGCRLLACAWRARSSPLPERRRATVALVAAAPAGTDSVWVTAAESCCRFRRCGSRRRRPHSCAGSPSRRATDGRDVVAGRRRRDFPRARWRRGA